MWSSSSRRIALLVFLGLCMHQAIAQSGEVASIGFAGPLSNVLVNSARQGAEIAVEMANEQVVKGEKRNLRFALDARDDKNSDDIAKFVARYFVNANVIGVVGHFGAAPAIATGPIYEKAGIAQIMFTPSAGQFTRMGYQSAFRIVGSAENTAVYMAEAAVTVLKGKRVAIISNETPYGKAIADSLEKELLGSPAKMVRRITISANTSDFNGALQAIKNEQVDVILFCPNITQIESFVTTVKRLNIPTAVLLTAGATDFDLFSDGKGDNLYAIEPSMPRGACLRWTQFQKKYIERYGQKPTTHSRYAFDAANVLIDAARRGEASEPRPNVVEMHKTTYMGLGGVISFDTSGNQKNPSYGIYRAQTSGWSLVQSFPASRSAQPGCT